MTSETVQAPTVSLNDRCTPGEDRIDSREREMASKAAATVDHRQGRRLPLDATIHHHLERPRRW